MRLSSRILLLQTHRPSRDSEGAFSSSTLMTHFFTFICRSAPGWRGGILEQTDWVLPPISWFG